MPPFARGGCTRARADPANEVHPQRRACLEGSTFAGIFSREARGFQDETAGELEAFSQGPMLLQVGPLIGSSSALRQPMATCPMLGCSLHRPARACARRDPPAHPRGAPLPQRRVVPALGARPSRPRREGPPRMLALPAEKSRQGCERREGGLSSPTCCLSHDTLFARTDGHNRGPSAHPQRAQAEKMLKLRGLFRSPARRLVCVAPRRQPGPRRAMVCRGASERLKKTGQSVCLGDMPGGSCPVSQPLLLVSRKENPP